VAAKGFSPATNTLPSTDLQGRRFYRPGVIATYCVLNLAVGLALYGLNVAHRGSRFMGYLLASASGAALVGMLAVAAIGKPVAGFGVLGLFIGLGLFKQESGPYRLALSRGGVDARWWPPLLWVVAAMIVVVAVAVIFGGDESVQ
jgi:hypothetical protein